MQFHHHCETVKFCSRMQVDNNFSGFLNWKGMRTALVHKDPVIVVDEGNISKIGLKIKFIINMESTDREENVEKALGCGWATCDPDYGVY